MEGLGGDDRPRCRWIGAGAVDDGSRAAAVCATAGLWLILFWFQLTESVFSLKKKKKKMKCFHVD